MIKKILQKIKRRMCSKNQLSTTRDFNEEPRLYGFKVLCGHRSCVIDGYPCVEYSSKYWSVPQNRCGPLTVFDDFFAAYRFVQDYMRPYWCKEYAIVPCSYIPSTETSVWRPNDIHPECAQLFLFSTRHLENMAEGTVLAGAVTLDPYRPPGIYLGPWKSPYIFIDPADYIPNSFGDKNPYVKFGIPKPLRGKGVPRNRDAIQKIRDTLAELGIGSADISS